MRGPKPTYSKKMINSWTRMPADYVAKLKAEAESLGMTYSELVRSILIVYVEEEIKAEEE